MKVISVRITVILLLLLGVFNNVCSQNSVSELLSKFKQIDLPLKEISTIVTYDSLDNVWLNSYLFPRDGKKTIIPNVISVEGELIRHDYTGLYPEDDMTVYYDIKDKDGSSVEKMCKFHHRIDAIGYVVLSEKYWSIIIRIESIESVFYDIWNIDKSTLEPVSQICLFYGFKESWNDASINYVEVESEITQDGAIVWHSNQRGLHTYRTWKIDEETGLFKVETERQEGEFEY
ncbi:MAG: hypothetical protein J6Q03_08560 [Paludibacteraceae bacterium]|nr:hypothetical protein [Paludibacteraceae bacterium]